MGRRWARGIGEKNEKSIENVGTTSVNDSEIKTFENKDQKPVNDKPIQVQEAIIRKILSEQDIGFIRKINEIEDKQIQRTVCSTMYDVAIQMLKRDKKFEDLKVNELIDKNSQIKETFKVFPERFFFLV